MFGGEASGGITVGELINVMSACIQHNMTACKVSMFQISSGFMCLADCLSDGKCGGRSYHETGIVLSGALR
jgi:hypothetical protein